MQQKSTVKQYAAVNRFRMKRGRALAHKIDQMARALGRSISIIDVGGWPPYWDNVPTNSISDLLIVNTAFPENLSDTIAPHVRLAEADARDLAKIESQSFDLVHSNSVIEHVGCWGDMQRMASETNRVGRSGWVQTPAFEFPIEPHFRRPFVHWLGQPIRRKLIGNPRYLKDQTLAGKRALIDRTNLLSKAEFAALFPQASIFVERFVLLPKSYVAQW